MEKRTEEQIIAQASIVVILGGKEYKIAPLVIRDSREWRAKVIKLIAPLPGYSKATTDDMEGFEQALTALLVTMPDQVIELFFDYAKELDPKEIEAVATDAEMADAFKEVIEVAFPLAQSAPEVVTRLYPTEKTEKTKKKSSL